jgi:hypothetical protein
MRIRLLVILILLAATGGHAAKYAGDPYQLGVGARSLAMGGAVVAGPFDGSVGYWNPAGIGTLSGRQVLAMHAETFGSLLNHDFIGYVDARGRRGSLVSGWSVYLYYLGGGGIKITRLDEFNRPYVEREESHGDYMLSGAVAGRISDKLRWGLAARLLYRDIGTETGKGLSVDAGLLYHAHPRLDLALVVTDITTGVIRYSGETFGTEANYESIYPALRPGLMLVQQWGEFAGRTTFAGEIRFENLQSSAQYWGGALSVDTHYGLEVGWREMLFGRAGFDVGRFTAGGGVVIRRVTVDFAYLHHSDLDETYRVSAGYGW